MSFKNAPKILLLNCTKLFRLVLTFNVLLQTLKFGINKKKKYHNKNKKNVRKRDKFINKIQVKISFFLFLQECMFFYQKFPIEYINLALPMNSIVKNSQHYFTSLIESSCKWIYKKYILFCLCLLFWLFYCSVYSLRKGTKKKK